jgi:hypothetical protein
MLLSFRREELVNSIFCTFHRLRCGQLINMTRSQEVSLACSISRLVRRQTMHDDGGDSRLSYPTHNGLDLDLLLILVILRSLLALKGLCRAYIE